MKDLPSTTQQGLDTAQGTVSHTPVHIQMQVQHRMGGATSRLASSRRLCVALAQHGGLAHTAARSSLPFPQPLPLPLLSLAPRAQAWGTMLFISGLNTSAQPSHLRRVGRTTTVRVGAAAAPEAPEATSSDSADTAQATSTGFERMGLRPELLTALQAMQISSPTDVQVWLCVHPCVP